MCVCECMYECMYICVHVNACMCVCTVIQELISNGESQDEISSAGRHRTLLLRQLCAFNPQRTLYVQQVALNCLKQPSLVLYLGLDQAERTQVSGV
jgi:hypothetical protein